MRPALLLLPVLLAPLGGCAASNPAGAPTPSAPTTGIAATENAYRDPSAAPGVVRGTFQPWAPRALAATYDPAIVPTGATAQVLAATGAGGVTVELGVTGMTPRRAYGAHLHTKPCTGIPGEAGPHYQHRKDPKTPSLDPGFANPRNEVWLDFTADASGAAAVSATQAWPFDENSPPRSLVIHAQSTKTGPGVAGTAGDRVACLTLPG